jgi:hypothetical protein
MQFAETKRNSGDQEHLANSRDRSRHNAAGRVQCAVNTGIVQDQLARKLESVVFTIAERVSGAIRLSHFGQAAFAVCPKQIHDSGAGYIALLVWRSTSAMSPWVEIFGIRVTVLRLGQFGNGRGPPDERVGIARTRIRHVRLNHRSAAGRACHTLPVTTILGEFHVIAVFALVHREETVTSTLAVDHAGSAVSELVFCLAGSRGIIEQKRRLSSVLSQCRCYTPDRVVAS